MRWYVLFFVISALVIVGCGDDGGSTTDTGPDMDSATGDGGGVIDCTGMPDGNACAEGFICLSGGCSPSRCGDGFLDPTSDETCDDGNEVPGDGCEPSCQPTCTMDADCDDGDPCNGLEVCNTSLSRCQAGGSGDGEMCTLAAGGDGVCSGGLCAPPGCGNSVVDAGEDCDDGMNGDNTDGCKDDCTYTCETDEDCSDGDMCTGEETCDTASHTCDDPADLECDDGDPCTSDSCDPAMGCVATLIDADGDGYAMAMCTTAGLMGEDCDEANSTVYPGAPELCDMIDNDCNGMVDDGTVTVTCSRDNDGDGYGNPDATMEACSCPSGYIPPRADGRTDCQDALPDVYEGQSGWFDTPYCSSTIRFCLGGGDTYDYNCDGVETKRYTGTGRSGCSIFSCFSGWTGSTAPACGDSAEFQPCSLVVRLDGTRDCVAGRTYSRAQECH